MRLYDGANPFENCLFFWTEEMGFCVTLLHLVARIHKQIPVKGLVFMASFCLRAVQSFIQSLDGLLPKYRKAIQTLDNPGKMSTLFLDYNLFQEAVSVPVMRGLLREIRFKWLTLCSIS
jgi:hypothetical protein